jgi:hypothetical protein
MAKAAAHDELAEGLELTANRPSVPPRRMISTTLFMRFIEDAFDSAGSMPSVGAGAQEVSSRRHRTLHVADRWAPLSGGAVAVNSSAVRGATGSLR